MSGVIIQSKWFTLLLFWPISKAECNNGHVCPAFKSGAVFLGVRKEKREPNERVPYSTKATLLPLECKKSQVCSFKSIVYTKRLFALP